MARGKKIYQESETIEEETKVETVQESEEISAHEEVKAEPVKVSDGKKRTVKNPAMASRKLVGRVSGDIIVFDKNGIAENVEAEDAEFLKGMNGYSVE